MLRIEAEQITVYQGDNQSIESELYAYLGDKKIGKIINTVSPGLTGLAESPEEDPCLFAKIYEGHGDTYHVCENPPNPRFNRSWSEVFENPELLPAGTTNIFIEE